MSTGPKKYLPQSWGGVSVRVVIAVASVLVVLLALSVGLTEMRRMSKENEPQPQATIPGQKWALADDPAAWFALKRTDGGQFEFTGSDGCNTVFSTNAELTNSHINFGDVGKTRMACPPPHDTEELFRFFLQHNDVPVDFSGGALHLQGPGGRWVVFDDEGEFKGD
ncbi:META domain-containing protein [Corynebacterium sp. TAE3-ERU12]|uniref:META domain-containing protein n=1 Tax=Corynebacterium sp. TAE3-ERU12 TaxID=2849491 RepID=UPI001C476618|nr:META domain-containing protein [Corynebacterium sp. TAE3-ERU12]MBV7295760.1 META domain-containing protein [Corynebacterium sp. TAE3-ERU12]